MRLKKLEIKGFKSFANETVIHFNEDVIGIVGPNGSGKSNIVDAIRWVLGEQSSRELRLDQMSSVIFNGAKKRKASGMAQVSLTFENTRNLLPTEYHAVTITRILYRSGDSEYRLNGVTCRLKDITSLFLDTGIGSNSYAIIALGMVDDILTDKDNSRRRMFEQAAGISKYKVRKREAINKLKNTEADLNRIEDLLFEIEGNLKTLEKQAKRTRRYFELKKEYKKLTVQLALHQIQAYKEKQNALKAQLTEEENRYREQEVRISRIEAQLEGEKKANLDKEKALSDRQRELNHLVGKIRARENEKRMHEQKLQFIEQDRAKQEEAIRNSTARIAQLTEDIERFRSELHYEKRLEEDLEVQLEEAEDFLREIRRNHGAIKSELDEIVQLQQAAEKEIFEIEKQKAVNVNQIENSQQERARDSEVIRQRREEVNKLEEKIAGIENQEKEKRKTLEQLEAQEAQRRRRLEAAEGQLEALTRKVAQVNRELDAKRNEHKLTKSMIESLEGFPESIRFLSNNQEWKDKALLLSDLIYVKEAYRVAIENYLEPFLNYYVVPRLADAYQAIQLLGNSQKGKANFFVLEAFEDYVGPMTMLPDTQRAIDLIETEHRYRNLCNYLLENVLITDREDFKGPLPGEDIVLLSQSGRIIHRRYSVSGGSIGLFEGKKIGRKKNLEFLDHAIQKLEREENRLSTEYFNLKKQIEELKGDQIDGAIQKERQGLNALMQEKVSLTTRLENFESFIREADEKRARIETTIRARETEIQHLNTALEEKKANLSQVLEQIANQDGSFREVADQLSQASNAYNNKNIEFIRQQNKVSNLQREAGFREKQLAESREALSAGQAAVEKATAEARQLQDQLDGFQRELLAAYEERKEKEAALTEAEQVYFKARGGINELEDQLRQHNRKRQESQVLINQLKDKATDVKFEISSVAQRLRIEFSIEINDIINEEASPDIDPAQVGEKVERLKKRLENYGEINPLAVEAYDEMKERYDSITRQRDDVIQAKESLMETIKEIEETATEQFLQAFDKARNFFIEVFRSLFTEDDTCDLLLLDPEDPLESKIEITARPKGKRPQTINQLSGGEKTLTATALLFALYLLKPAPFCIFDEVDAPLDDANISKFNKIIKKFSKDSQFIIVTHNKLTMAAVDTIYGVYMAEQGVSGVSQVDFRDFEHSGAFQVAGD